MKKILVIISIMVILLLAAACVPAASISTEPTSVAGAFLNTEYENAANLRSQLAFGIIKLADTAVPVNQEQALQLIPLWQGIIALSGDSTTATEELIAIQDQITTALTTEQLDAIADMKITTADLDAFYAEFGIVMPTPIPGVTKVPGSGSSKTDEEKAAAQATARALGQTTGSGQSAKTLLFEKVIEFLNGIQ